MATSRGADELVIAGFDDPVVPLANARILHRLLPHSSVCRYSGGHVDLIATAVEPSPIIAMFRKNGLKHANMNTDHHRGQRRTSGAGDAAGRQHPAYRCEVRIHEIGNHPQTPQPGPGAVRTGHGASEVLT